jgi:hypothetical protein
MLTLQMQREYSLLSASFSKRARLTVTFKLPDILGTKKEVKGLEKKVKKAKSKNTMKKRPFTYPGTHYTLPSKRKIFEGRDLLAKLLVSQRSDNTTQAGFVLTVGDGIARVYGLRDVSAGEMVEFQRAKLTGMGFKFRS